MNAQPRTSKRTRSAPERHDPDSVAGSHSSKAEQAAYAKKRKLDAAKRIAANQALATLYNCPPKRAPAAAKPHAPSAEVGARAPSAAAPAAAPAAPAPVTAVAVAPAPPPPALTVDVSPPAADPVDVVMELPDLTPLAPTSPAHYGGWASTLPRSPSLLPALLQPEATETLTTDLASALNADASDLAAIGNELCLEPAPSASGWSGWRHVSHPKPIDGEGVLGMVWRKEREAAEKAAAAKAAAAGGGQRAAAERAAAAKAATERAAAAKAATERAAAAKAATERAAAAKAATERAAAAKAAAATEAAAVVLAQPIGRNAFNCGWAQVDTSAAPKGWIPHHGPQAYALGKQRDERERLEALQLEADRRRRESERAAAAQRQAAAAAAAASSSSSESDSECDDPNYDPNYDPNREQQVAVYARRVVNAVAVRAIPTAALHAAAALALADGAQQKQKAQAARLAKALPKPKAKATPKAKAIQKKAPRMTKATPAAEKQMPGAIDAASDYNSILAAGPRPLAPSEYAIADDPDMQRLGIADKKGVKARISEVLPDLSVETHGQYANGIVSALSTFKTDAYSGIATFRTFWNAFESPDPSRSKRIAFADFLAVNTYPALGVTKLDVKGAKHKHLTSWVSGYERALDLFLDA